MRHTLHKWKCTQPMQIVFHRSGHQHGVVPFALAHNSPSALADFPQIHGRQRQVGRVHRQMLAGATLQRLCREIVFRVLQVEWCTSLVLQLQAEQVAATTGISLTRDTSSQNCHARQEPYTYTDKDICQSGFHISSHIRKSYRFSHCLLHVCKYKHFSADTKHFATTPTTNSRNLNYIKPPHKVHRFGDYAESCLFFHNFAPTDKLMLRKKRHSRKKTPRLICP